MTAVSSVMRSLVAGVAFGGTLASAPAHSAQPSAVPRIAVL